VKVYQTKDTPPDYREDLTQEEKDTIRDWVKDSKPFNNALRHTVDHEYFNGDSEKYEIALASAVILSNVIEKSKLQEGYRIHRGLGSYDIGKVKIALQERELTGMSPLISDNGFVAVSTEFQSAYKYSVGGENEDEYILLSKLKRGKKALFIGNENPTHDKKQGEILLQAGTGYYIIGEDVDTTDSGKVVHLITVVFVEDA